MKRLSIMLIAGEHSGDQLAANLVQALRAAFIDRVRSSRDYQPLATTLDPHFWGAGGPRMKAAGVDLALDLTKHSVIGLFEVFRKIRQFRRIFHQLQTLACERQPDLIVCVDFSGFNRRFAHALRQRLRRTRDSFHDWHPKIVQYVSPQVWASRPGRVRGMAEDYDLLLSLFPFEPEWYRGRAPDLRVIFVGHPLAEQYLTRTPEPARDGTIVGKPPRLVLLPGSRVGEVQQHLPIMLGGLARLRAALPDLQAELVAPTESLEKLCHELGASQPGVITHVRGLPEALQRADLAFASTGTVTLECACAGVPTVAIYRVSWTLYQIGRRIVRVKYLAMPNLLANAEVFPEFVQHAATPENLARAGRELLTNLERRAAIQKQLREVCRALGPTGASRRAANEILALLTP